MTKTYSNKLTFTNVDDQADGSTKFEIKDLPALEAGERYEVKYDVDFTRTDQQKVTKIKNLAHVESGNHGGNPSYEVVVPVERSIEKEGGYDSTSNTFWWRIKLNNGNGEDVSGWTVNDAVQDGYKIVGDVRILRIENGSYVQVVDINDFDGQDGFTINLNNYIKALPDDKKKEDFWIEYRTEAPAGNPGGTVSETNNAGYQPEQGTGSSTKTTVTGTIRDWSVWKGVSRKDISGLNSDGTGILYEFWQSKVTIGAGKLTSFTYTDEIEPVLDDQSNDQHYATAADLEKYFIKAESTSQNRNTGLYLKIDEYNRYNYNGASEPTTRSDFHGEDQNQSDVTIMVTYYDADGNEVKPADSSTHVKKFVVTVTPMGGKTINAQSLVLKEYRTMVNTTTQKAGQTWTIKNTGKVKDKTSEAQDEHTRPHKFVKEVYTGKTKNGEPLYQEGDQKVPYKWDLSYLADKIQLDEGQLLYRLMLHTSQDENGKNIIITDTLPAGMTVVENSVYAAFYENVWWQPNSNNNGTDFNTDKNKPTYTTIKNSDGTTTLTITILNYTYSSSYPDVAVYYKVSVAEDPAWNDPAKLNKAYKNSASWNGQTSSDNVTVEREKTVIGKSGVQLDENGHPVQIGSDGKPTTTPAGKIRYTIVINSAADDLVPNADTLTLVDTMGNISNPQLDLSSVNLYNYDSTEENHIGTKLISTSYEMVYDTTNRKMTLTVPDSKAMILEYEYSIDENYAGNQTITNTAALNGKWTSADSAKLVEIKSSATAKHNQIIIYKVDSRNYRKTLSGAEFNLASFAYDSSTGKGTWNPAGQALSTDQYGEITFNLFGSDKTLTENTLYKLTESKAPDGYGLDATPHYFIWKAESISDDDAYNAANAGNKANENGTGGVDRSKITFFSNGGGKMYIPNEYTRIGVIKSWAKSDGSADKPPEGTTVNVTLYRQTLAPVNYCKVQATVIDQNGNRQEGDLIYVKRGSSITIMSQDNTGQSATIKYGATTASVLTETYNYNPHYKYTIEEVTTDLTDIVITTNGWPGKPFYLDYEKPDLKLSDPPVIDDKQVLSNENNWTYSWDGRPKMDNEGHPYYYTVKETAVTQNGKDISGQFTTTYSNNDGIQYGQMVITNTAKKDEITLPSTGGMGTWIFRALGIISIGIGIEILLFIKRKIEIGGKGL